MASTAPLVREYAFVGLRLKMDIQQNSLTSSAMLCRYGDTNDVFPIVGLVDIDETPIHCNRLTLLSSANKLRVEAARWSLFIPSLKGTKRSYVCRNFVVYYGR